jgi:hypothetical protein
MLFYTKSGMLVIKITVKKLKQAKCFVTLYLFARETYGLYIPPITELETMTLLKPE